MRLYGKNPVAERLKTNPKSVRKLYIQQGADGVSYIRKKAHQWRIPVIPAARSKIIKMARNVNTQGVLADVDDFAYQSFDDMLARAKKKKESLVFLDNLNDPQNLGAIIRSLACLGGFNIVLPTRDSVGVTEAVLRVASGGDNHVPVAQATNLARAIESAREAGFCIAGAVVEGGVAVTEVSFPPQVALVVGSEQKGIRDGIKKYLDLHLTIPMARAKLSFNVAHATTVFCYEIVRQRTTE